MTTTKTYNLEQILTAWIVNNNPSAVRRVLINNSLILPSANPSKSQMIKILYNYYLSNGKATLLSLLKQIPVSVGTSESQKMALANSYQEISSINTGSSIAMYQPYSRIAGQSADKWWNDVLDKTLDVVLGSSTTTVEPTVTTTTTTSPLVIAGLIAGVILVLGLAYFLLGKGASA